MLSAWRGTSLLWEPTVKSSSLAARSILALACVLAVAVGGRGQDSAVKDAFREGANAMHNGNPGKAESAFRRAVKLAPSMAEAHLDLGLVLGREGKTSEAIASLRQALVLDNSLPSAHMFLGIFLYQDNHADEAERELQEELTHNPDSVESLTWLGTVDLSENNPDRAVVPLDRASLLAPDDLNILELRARAHGQVAKNTYARMAKLDPNSWHVHHVQAQLDADEGKHAEAITEEQAAIGLQPSNPDLYEELGDQYRATSQLEAAETAYRKGLALGPANPVAMYNLGSAEVERGESAQGVPLLQRALTSYPGSPVAEYYLGRGLADLGKDDDALVWLKKAADAGGPRDLTQRSWYELTRVYRKLHRPSDAQAALAHYNQLRVLKDKQGAQQVEDWKKLGQADPPTSTLPETR